MSDTTPERGLSAELRRRALKAYPAQAALDLRAAADEIDRLCDAGVEEVAAKRRAEDARVGEYRARVKAERQLRAVNEDVRVAFMHLEEVILRLPGRWNDPLVPDECGDALQRAYASLNAIRAGSSVENTQ